MGVAGFSLHLFFPLSGLCGLKRINRTPRCRSSLPPILRAFHCCRGDIMERVMSLPKCTHTAHALTWFPQQPNHSSFLPAHVTIRVQWKASCIPRKHWNIKQKSGARHSCHPGLWWTTIAFSSGFFFCLKPASTVWLTAAKVKWAVRFNTFTHSLLIHQRLEVWHIFGSACNSDLGQ